MSLRALRYSASLDVQSTESELRALLSSMQERTTTYERALPGMLIGGGPLSSYLGRIYSRMNTPLRRLRDTITITSYTECTYILCPDSRVYNVFCISYCVVCLKLVNVSGTSRYIVCSMHRLGRMAWHVTLNCLVLILQ